MFSFPLTLNEHFPEDLPVWPEPVHIDKIITLSAFQTTISLSVDDFLALERSRSGILEHLFELRRPKTLADRFMCHYLLALTVRAAAAILCFGVLASRLNAQTHKAGDNMNL